MLKCSFSRIYSSKLTVHLLLLVTYGWTAHTLAEPKPALKQDANKQSSTVKPEQTIEMLDWLGSFEEDELTELDEAMSALEKQPTAVRATPAKAISKQHKITGVQP